MYKTEEGGLFMKETKKIPKRIISVLLCLLMVFPAVLAPLTEASAAVRGNTSIYRTLYLEDVYPQIGQIGEAYIVGTNESASYSTH